ncbi:MAG: ATP-dependent DNA helicase [Candidatus Bathyarchaeota archaeon]|nr:MAG: ATP-dependent DNA helicase [Candidatus Bathyarchaeota archaeon]
MPERKIAKLGVKIGKAMVRKSRRARSKDKWLPDGYELRKGQVEFISEASQALEDGRIFLGSAPCGIGKSLASLIAVLPKLEKGKLLITFRTRSQLYIYLKELRALNLGFSAISFFSKKSMCPLQVKGSFSYVDFSEECRRLKENCSSFTKPYCKFYWKTLRKKWDAEELALDCASKILSPIESVRVMRRQGFCAHEALKAVLNKAEIFLGTYHYLFNPRIREVMLQSLRTDLSSVYVIIDEAHNLPTFSRELLSSQLTQGTVERALSETRRFRCKTSSLVKECLGVLENQVFERAQHILKSERLKRVRPEELGDHFISQTNFSGIEVGDILQNYGEYVKQKRNELGHENLLSYTHKIGEFLGDFFSKVENKYIHLIRRDWEGNVLLEIRSFDGREITDPVLQQARGSILMSGSLSPLKVYRDLVLYDQDDANLKEFASPFPSDNRLILAATDVSSQYGKRTDEMLAKWKTYIEAISAASKGNVATFFTSYDMMQRTLRLVEIDRDIIIEQRNTERNTVVRQLKKSVNNALFGVMGGKLSEGIDYPNNLLTCVTAVGLPYATWNVYEKALIDYCDIQFPHNGESYAYLTPAILRLVQACGRVHRSPTDKGVIIILDKRITHPNVKQQLPSNYQKELQIIQTPNEAARKMRLFWKKHGQTL